MAGITDTVISSPSEARVRAERVEFLYGSPTVIPINVLNAALAAVLLWQVYPHGLVVSWVGAVALAVAARMLLWIRFRTRKRGPHDLHAWARAYAVGAAVTGVLWGLLATVTLVTDNPSYYVFAAFVLGGMTAGAAVKDSAYPAAFFGFAAPAILPMAAALMAKGQFVFLEMGLLLAAFAAVLAVVGVANSRWITDNIRLRIEQATLNEGLRRKTSELAQAAAEGARIAAALQEREADLKQAQRLAHLGSWVWEAANGQVERSDELFRMFGLPPGGPSQPFEGLQRVLPPEGLARLEAAFLACRDRGTPYSIDLEVVRADGSVAWIETRGEAERDDQGRVIRVRGMAQDITERKLAERDITALHQRMSENLETLRRHEQEMTAVARLSDLLQACHSREEAYPLIASTAADLFRGTSGALAIVAHAGAELQTTAQWGDGPVGLAAFGVDDCWALRTGQAYDSGPQPGTRCPHLASVPPGPCACLPLTVRGETGGLLHLCAPEARSIDEDLHRLMLSFGDVVKLSLSNLKLREALSEQAMRDQLTGLFNRRYLIETLPREIRRAERDRTTLTVVMLDVDHFKAFNDEHGHDAGDLVLRELAGLLGGALRAGDIACRYGGEEILLVLPECDLEHARVRLGLIRAEIRRRRLVFRRQPLPRVTISAGLAELSETLPDAQALIAAADQALYAAKRGGRDRIEAYRGEPEPASAAAAHG